MLHVVDHAQYLPGRSPALEGDDADPQQRHPAPAPVSCGAPPITAVVGTWYTVHAPTTVQTPANPAEIAGYEAAQEAGSQPRAQLPADRPRL